MTSVYTCVLLFCRYSYAWNKACRGVTTISREMYVQGLHLELDCSWSKYKCRGSMRLTRNQTDDEWHEAAIGLSGSLCPRLLLKINEHTAVRESSIHCASSSSVRTRFWRETNCTRGNNLLLRKTVLASRNRHKNEVILVPITVNENEFLLVKKYLLMKGVCSVENRILDNVGMSLPSA